MKSIQKCIFLVLAMLFATPTFASGLPPGYPPPPPGVQTPVWAQYFATSRLAAVEWMEKLKSASPSKLKSMGLSKFDLSKSATLEDLNCLALRIAQTMLRNDDMTEASNNMEHDINKRCGDGGDGSGGLGVAVWKGFIREVAKESVKSQTRSIMADPEFWQTLVAITRQMTFYSATLTAENLRLLATDPQNASPGAKAAVATVSVALGGAVVLGAVAPEAAAAAVVPMLPVTQKKQ